MNCLFEMQKPIDSLVIQVDFPVFNTPFLFDHASPDFQNCAMLDFMIFSCLLVNVRFPFGVGQSVFIDSTAE